MGNVLIVSKPGQLRDGLHALLETVPGVGLVSITESAELALEYLSETYTALVLLVVDSHDQDFKAVVKLKETCPQTELLVLVTSEEDHQAVVAQNVDAAVFSGARASELSTTIEALLLEDC